MEVATVGDGTGRGLFLNYDYDDPDGRPGTGATALAGAIIRAALVDLADHREHVRNGAREFIRSAWFSMLAEGCNLDPVAVLERLGRRGIRL